MTYQQQFNDLRNAFAGDRNRYGHSLASWLTDYEFVYCDTIQELTTLWLSKMHAQHPKGLPQQWGNITHTNNPLATIKLFASLYHSYILNPEGNK